MKLSRPFRFLFHLFRDEELQTLYMMLLGVLAVGTIAFSYLEGWHVFDAFYFSAITLTTVGYGDLSPHTLGGRMFAILYIFIGIQIMLVTINIITFQLVRHEQAKVRERHKKQQVPELAPELVTTEEEK